MDELAELKDLVLHYARGIWRHRWIMIAVSVMVFLAGAVFVDRIKDRYTAETKVYIDSTSILRPLLKGLTVQTDFEEIVQLMVKQLLSRPNLERAIRVMDLDLGIDGTLGMDTLIGKIRKKVEITANRRSGVYTIAYNDTDREKAKRMVQTLLDIFVEDTLGKSVVQSDTAISFLDQQIEKYDTLLRDAEQRREEFKRKNIGLMPQDGVTYYAQLQDVERKIEQGVQTLSELSNRRDKLETKIFELEASNAADQMPVKTSLDSRIEEQEKRLDELLILYTEQHPDVINARHVLETLRERKKSEKDQSSSVSSIRDNPIYQELQILLSQTEADLSSVTARVQSLRAKQRKLKQLVDIVPQIESEMQRLNRDYEVHHDNYTAFVARREQARISEDVEAGTEQVKFRVIEPPYVPIKPDYPNRVLFDLAVLVFALGVGGGIALLVSLLQPVFYNQIILARAIDRPVLGAVSKFDTANVLAKRSKDLVVFGTVVTAFFVMVGTIIILHSRDVLIFSWLLSRLIEV